MITNLSDHRLDAGINAAREALDHDIAVSGGAKRVARGVLARVKDERFQRLPWFAIAAGLVLAAGLGSLVDAALVSVGDNNVVEVVVLDPLVFGPTELDGR